ncbi:MAG: hypothetical protein FWE64_04600 [Alphaproteobacteria bacterium]|nr:hypothetical protein [Alphaproteobacteria bacterium]
MFLVQFIRIPCPGISDDITSDLFVIIHIADYMFVIVALERRPLQLC